MPEPSPEPSPEPTPDLQLEIVEQPDPGTDLGTHLPEIVETTEQDIPAQPDASAPANDTAVSAEPETSDAPATIESAAEPTPKKKNGGCNSSPGAPNPDAALLLVVLVAIVLCTRQRQQS